MVEKKEIDMVGLSKMPFAFGWLTVMPFAFRELWGLTAVPFVFRQSKGLKEYPKRRRCVHYGEDTRMKNEVDSNVSGTPEGKCQVFCLRKDV